MRSVFLVLLLAGAAFAQGDPYTVTVTASETPNIQPDQALITGYLETPVSESLDEVVKTLEPAGITAANLTGVNTINGGLRPNPNAILWSFTLAVPVANLNAALTAFTQIAKSAVTSLYYSVQGLQVSPQLMAAQQCPFGGLMASAQAQALALAQAAGFGLGPLLAISDGSVGAYSGSLATGNLVLNTITGTSFTIQTLPACTVVAKFSLMTGP